MWSTTKAIFPCQKWHGWGGLALWRLAVSDRKQPKPQQITWSFIWHKGDADPEKWALCNSLVRGAEKGNSQNIFAFKMLLKHSISKGDKIKRRQRQIPTILVGIPFPFAVPSTKMEGLASFFKSKHLNFEESCATLCNYLVPDKMGWFSIWSCLKINLGGPFSQKGKGYAHNSMSTYENLFCVPTNGTNNYPSRKVFLI